MSKTGKIRLQEAFSFLLRFHPTNSSQQGDMFIGSFRLLSFHVWFSSLDSSFDSPYVSKTCRSPRSVVIEGGKGETARNPPSFLSFSWRFSSRCITWRISSRGIKERSHKRMGRLRWSILYVYDPSFCCLLAKCVPISVSQGSGKIYPLHPQSCPFLSHQFCILSFILHLVSP